MRFRDAAEDELAAIAYARTIALDVQCPGVAHSRRGSTSDRCVICDAARDGTIEVLITDIERDALRCIARGRESAPYLLRRLVRLGLAEFVRGALALTPRGRALLARCAHDLS